MQTAVLIVGHGTREPEGTYAFLELVSSVQRQIGSYVQPAFLEIASPSVPEGAGHCLSTGAGRLLVIPAFLFGGRDSKKKLPKALEDFQKENPHLAVSFMPSVGTDGLIVEILKERFISAVQPPVSPDTAVLLVARGFSDREAIAEMEEVRMRFAQETGLQVVRHAFVEIASPSIADGIEACLASQAKRIVILPYLLFPGLMLKKIKDQADVIRSGKAGEIPILVADCLGPHPKLTELLVDRIRKEL